MMHNGNIDPECIVLSEKIAQIPISREIKFVNQNFNETVFIVSNKKKL